MDLINMAEKTTFIERALADGYAEITGEGKTERIRYKAAGHSERWADPEEKVRAEFWAELIYKYHCCPGDDFFIPCSRLLARQLSLV
jgi:type I restriction enzyme M protein